MTESVNQMEPTKSGSGTANSALNSLTESPPHVPHLSKHSNVTELVSTYHCTFNHINAVLIYADLRLVRDLNLLYQKLFELGDSYINQSPWRRPMEARAQSDDAWQTMSKVTVSRLL